MLISLCGMFLMGMAFMNGLAIGAIVGVLLMMAVSLTLLPAFLAICGRRVNETTRAALIAVTIFIIGSIVGVLSADPMPFLIGLLIAVGVYVVSFCVRSLRTPLPHRAKKPNEQTFWYKWSRLVQHRPWPMLVARHRDPGAADDPAVLDPARLRRHGQPARDARPPAGPTTCSPRASVPGSADGP